MANSSGGRIRSISYAKYGYIFILPFFLVYAIFQIYPLFNTFYLSFFGNGTSDAMVEKGLSIYNNVGFNNFKILLSGGENLQDKAAHSEFVQTLINTVILWVGNFIPQIVLSVVLAAWFTNARLKIPGKGAYKIIMYMPNIITAASSAALFIMLLGESEGGQVNSLLMKLGMDETIKFVSDKLPSRVVIMLIQTWMWYGNTTIMLMSGIMGINGSLFEAASIDGASHTQQFFKITIPLLKPIMLYTVVTSMIGGLQMYDIPALYKIGDNVKPHTKTIAVYIYDHFHSSVSPNYGYAAAASVLLFFITSILGSICFAINRDKDTKTKIRKKTSKLL